MIRGYVCLCGRRGGWTNWENQFQLDRVAPLVADPHRDNSTTMPKTTNLRFTPYIVVISKTNNATLNTFRFGMSETKQEILESLIKL